MARLLICALAILLGYNQAYAADLAAYADEPVAPDPFVWTGLHIGISGGFGFNSDDPNYSYVNVPRDVIPRLPTSAKLDPDGGVFGGSIGFDKQLGQLVLGVEGDMSWTRFDDKGIHHVAGDPSIGFPPLKFETRYEMEWLSTIRGRIGVALDNWLLYGTAGVAFGHVSLDSSVTVGDPPLGMLTGSEETTKTGWTAGGGGAVAVTPHISLKAEAIYYDLGDVTVAATNPLQASILVTDQDVNGVIARAGLDYRF